jgi:DNA-binding NtrC family response regulator
MRVQQGLFRSDLYFRLNVLRIDMPPLRTRRSDISLLARHFLRKYSAGTDVATSLSQSAIRRLELHDWPGNVRELANVVQRAVVAAGGGPILPAHFSFDEKGPETRLGGGSFRDERNRVIARFEGQFVQDLLGRHGGNVTHAAREAGKDRRAFGRLVKKYCRGPAGHRANSA